MPDNRIAYINEIPHFKGEYQLSKKQLKRLLAGRWKDKDDDYIIKELIKSDQSRNRRIGYHQLNKALLEDNENCQLVLRLRLAITEDLINYFRREKCKLKRELKPYKLKEAAPE